MNPRPLIVITCGAPLARRLTDLRADLARHGTPFDRLIVTTAAEHWTHERSELAARPRTAGLVVIFPLTFNTAGKTAAGISDTPAAAILCEALGARAPVLAVPMVNTTLAEHPQWERTSAALTAGGWTWYSPTTSHTTPTPEPVAHGSGDHITTTFDTALLAAHITDRLAHE